MEWECDCVSCEGVEWESDCVSCEGVEMGV